MLSATIRRPSSSRLESIYEQWPAGRLGHGGGGATTLRVYARLKLQGTLSTSRHTNSLIWELWGEQPNLNPTAPDGTPQTSPEHVRRHPGRHLTLVLSMIHQNGPETWAVKFQADDGTTEFLEGEKYGDFEGLYFRYPIENFYAWFLATASGTVHITTPNGTTAEERASGWRFT